MDLACAVVVNGAALPHAKVGGAVRPLDVEDQVLHEGHLVGTVDDLEKLTHV